VKDNRDLSRHVCLLSDLSRQAFMDWLAVGEPHVALEVTLMRKTRAAFKLALLFCRQHEDQLQADSCANSLDLAIYIYIFMFYVLFSF